MTALEVGYLFVKKTSEVLTCLKEDQSIQQSYGL